MNSLDIDSAIALVAITFIVLMAVRAWRSGTLGGIQVLCSWAAGIAAAAWCYDNGIGVLSEYVGVEFNQLWSVAVAAVLAIIGFVVGRMVTKSIIQSTFGPDGPLHAWLQGPSGAVVSLIPSIVLITVACLAIRWMGTNYELFQIDRVSRQPDTFVGDAYPDHSPLTDWRDAIERWPYSENVFDQLAAPTSQARRNLAAYLIAANNSSNIRASLKKNADTKAIATHPTVVALVEEESITTLIKGETGAVLKYKALLGNKLLRDAMRDEQLFARLNAVDLPHIIEETVSEQKIPKQQSWLQRIFS